MLFESLKALHIIFVVTWFSGLFYVVRLFIYHVEALEALAKISSSPSSSPQTQAPAQTQASASSATASAQHGEYALLIKQLKLMQKRLWFGIAWPSAILAMLSGLSLLRSFLPLSSHPWLIAKLTLVFLLFLYQLHCHRILNHLKACDRPRYSSHYLRIYNELATLFLVSIVFLVVLKNALSGLAALTGLAGLSCGLLAGIACYKKNRRNNFSRGKFEDGR